MDKIIIIGAGPAGITAAYEFAKTGKYDVTVLEASDHIGGISSTIKHNGNRMDLGGHRFFSRDKEVLEWWAHFLPLQGHPSVDDIILNREKKWADSGPDPETHDDVMLSRERVSRILYNKKFFDYPVSISMRTILNMGFSKTFTAGTGYFYSQIFKRKEDSLEDFYINRFGKPLYRMFFEKYTEKVWGVHPSRLDPDWGAQRVKGLSLMSVLKNAIFKPKQKETSLIENFLYPKYGPGQLWEKVAKSVTEMNGSVLLNHKVVRIKSKDGRIKSVVVENDGKQIEFECDYLISSMPIRDLIADMKDVDLPKDVVAIAEGLQYRDFLTVGLLVERLAIRNTTKIKTINNIIPDTWIYIQEPDVKIGRLQIFNNWSPYMVKDFQEHVWLGLEYFCNEGDNLWDMDDDELKSLAINELQQIGMIDGGNVLDSVVVRVVKAYPSYYGTYREFDKVKDFLNSIPNLYCIGRNGQHRYNNMDHSMLTAIEAFRHIDCGKSDKESIWKINTEETYHEKISSE